MPTPRASPMFTEITVFRLSRQTAHSRPLSTVTRFIMETTSSGMNSPGENVSPIKDCAYSTVAFFIESRFPSTLFMRASFPNLPNCIHDIYNIITFHRNFIKGDYQNPTTDVKKTDNCPSALTPNSKSRVII